MQNNSDSYAYIVNSSVPQNQAPNRGMPMIPPGANYPGYPYAVAPQYAPQYYMPANVGYAMAPPGYPGYIPASPYGHQNLPHSQKRRKVENRTVVARCDPCEKDFYSMGALESHRKEHSTCSYAGCEFSASKNMLVKHAIIEHEKYLPKLDTDEDVQKWREERKKNFPTKTRIEEKRKDIEEKISRGESVSEKPSRYNLDPFEFLSGGGSKEKYRSAKKGKGNKDRNTPKKPRPKLRTRLLAESVKEERSVILQCFRRFSQTNFIAPYELNS